jgi:5-formyltetrahydrofolate cyclo-ligase
MKHTLRQHFTQIRDSIPANEKIQMEQIIQNKILQMPEFQKAQNILLYASIKSEVSLRPIKEFCIENKQLFLPEIHGKTLKIRQVENLQSLQNGQFEIPTPHPHSREITPAEIDICLIPGITFDLQGHRIGYGKGFYDRLLPQLNCPKIGIAFDCQISEKIPTESHDHQLDMLITEKRTLQF